MTSRDAHFFEGKSVICHMSGDAKFFVLGNFLNLAWHSQKEYDILMKSINISINQVNFHIYYGAVKASKEISMLKNPKTTSREVFFNSVKSVLLHHREKEELYEIKGSISNF